MPKTLKDSVTTLDQTSSLPTGYHSILEEIKSKIKEAQSRALISVNRELIAVYGRIGKTIHNQQQDQTALWETSIVGEFAIDVQNSFPGVKGHSHRNLWIMRELYRSYQDNPKLQTLSAEISWSNNELKNEIPTLDQISKLLGFEE